MAQGTCSVDGCGRPVLARGWCVTHYNRWWAHGDVLADQPFFRRPSRDFWANVNKDDPSGCWLWIGTPFRDGYGAFRTADGRLLRASIAALELVYGRVEGRPWALHHCDNPPCVKVTGDPATDHLYWGTPSQNTQDREARRPPRARSALGRYA